MKTLITRGAVAAAMLALITHRGAAQSVLAEAKTKAQNAAAATNAHIAAEQQPEGAVKQAGKPVSDAKATASQTKAPATTVAVSPNTKPQQPASTVARAGTKLTIATTDTAGPPPTIMREMYSYAADGRRDPFVSLLTTNELRPTLSDLRLTGIMYDHSVSRRSVATLRDLGTNAQYRVTQGSKLGRMTVAAIRLKTILFTIDEFGTTRQDSLVMGDSTKVRGK